MCNYSYTNPIDSNRFEYELFEDFEFRWYSNTNHIYCQSYKIIFPVNKQNGHVDKYTHTHTHSVSTFKITITDGLNSNIMECD